MTDEEIERAAVEKARAYQQQQKAEDAEAVDRFVASQALNELKRRELLAKARGAFRMSRQNRLDDVDWLRICEADFPNGDQRLRRNDRIGLCLSVAAVVMVVIWLGFAIWGWLQ